MRINDHGARNEWQCQGPSDSGIYFRPGHHKTLDRHRGTYCRGDPGHSHSVGYYHG